MKLTYTFYIAASVEKIWDIITKPEGTEKIFYGARIKSNLTKGSKIEYIGPGRDGQETLHIYGEVLEYKAYQCFQHTSQVGQVYQNNRQSYKSVITYLLSDMGNYRRLDVIHDQWDEQDPSYENTKANWWLMLSNIKTLAETGNALEIGLHEI